MSDTEKNDDFLDFEDEALLEEDALDGNDETFLSDLPDEDLDQDEAWDEFDETTSAENSAPAAQKQKSFISRYFNILLIGAAVLIGGGVLYSQLSGGNSSAPPSAVDTPSAALEGEVASFTNPSQASETSSETDTSGLDLDLANLQKSDSRAPAKLIYEDDIKTLEEENVTVSQKESIDYASQEIAPEADFFAESSDKDALTPMPNPSAEKAEEGAPTPEPIQNSTPEMMMEEPQIVSPVADNTVTESETSVITPPPTTEAVSPEPAVEQNPQEAVDVLIAVNKDTAENDPAVAEKINSLSAENSALNEKLLAAETKAKSLEDSVAALEEKIAVLEKEGLENKKKQ
jgi:hypothetical protein